MAKRKTTSIPEEYSLWVRPMRHLLDDGKPIGQVTMLALSPIAGEALPVCALTYTDRNRLIAWPILPSNPGTSPFPLDHVTLEFPSGAIHATGFTSDGKRNAVSQSWHLHEFPESSLAFWFRLVVRRSVIESQEREIERWMKSPASDTKRRTDEFARYGQSIRIIDVSLPPGEPMGDYVLCSFFVIEVDVEPHITSEIFLCGDVDSEIDDWPDTTEFGMTRKKLQVGPKRLLVATACPPGRSGKDVAVGFPQRSQISPKADQVETDVPPHLRDWWNRMGGPQYGKPKDMPTLFSYVVDHDHGFAPNPSGGLCTLAKCKYGTKKRNIVELAQVGDWIAGTGGADLKKSAGHGKLIYAMRVDEKIPLSQYCQAYQGKRVDAEHVVSEDGRFALLSRHYFYFGRNAIDISEIPQEYLDHNFEKRGPGHRSDFPERFIEDFVSWLEASFTKGVHGLPCKPLAKYAVPKCTPRVKRRRPCR